MQHLQIKRMVQNNCITLCVAVFVLGCVCVCVCFEVVFGRVDGMLYLYARRPETYLSYNFIICLFVCCVGLLDRETGENGDFCPFFLQI